MPGVKINFFKCDMLSQVLLNRDFFCFKFQHILPNTDKIAIFGILSRGFCLRDNIKKLMEMLISFSCILANKNFEDNCKINIYVFLETSWYKKTIEKKNVCVSTYKGKTLQIVIFLAYKYFFHSKLLYSYIIKK